ncbi:unnamed protein product [Amoebophrya sp. A120]|nr:unnamed protein product [Amoebophrya sp. A120]|eukprot:GSA120T00000702001.1
MLGATTRLFLAAAASQGSLQLVNAAAAAASSSGSKDNAAGPVSPTALKVDYPAKPATFLYVTKSEYEKKFLNSLPSGHKCRNTKEVLKQSFDKKKTTFYITDADCKQAFNAWKTRVSRLATPTGTQNVTVHCELAQLQTVEEALTGKPISAKRSQRILMVPVKLDVGSETCPASEQADEQTQEISLLDDNTLTGPAPASPPADMAAGVAQLASPISSPIAGCRPRTSAKRSADHFSSNMINPNDPLLLSPAAKRARGSLSNGEQQTRSIFNPKRYLLGKHVPRPQKTAFSAFTVKGVQERGAVKNVFLLADKEDGQKILEFCFEQAALHARILLDVTATYRKYQSSRVYARADRDGTTEFMPLTDWLYRKEDNGIARNARAETVVMDGKLDRVELADGVALEERNWLAAKRADFVRKTTELARKVHSGDGSAFQKLKCELKRGRFDTALKSSFGALKNYKTRRSLQWVSYIGVVAASYLLSNVVANAAGKVVGPAAANFAAQAAPEQVSVQYMAQWIPSISNRITIPVKGPAQLLANYIPSTFWEKNAAAYLKRKMQEHGALFMVAGAGFIQYDVLGKLMNYLSPEGDLKDAIKFDEKEMKKLATEFANVRSDLVALKENDYIYVNREGNTLSFWQKFFASEDLIFHEGSFGKVVKTPTGPIKPNGAGMYEFVPEGMSKTDKLEILWNVGGGDTPEVTARSGQHKPATLKKFLAEGKMMKITPKK